MGALTGTVVVELAAQGPGPFCATLLADHGARVVRVSNLRKKSLPGLEGAAEPMVRGREDVALDLRADDDRARFLDLIADADVLVEGFRPGVTERLGIGPAECLARNDRLVYARITGWGQEGPLAARAGHDIDYIALTGALAAIGPVAQPVPPLNLLGDYAGGAMFAAFGILAALLERTRSGRGQVVDAAMVDGVGYLMSPFFELAAAGAWRDARVDNTLDGGAPFYAVYTTADGRHVAVGALEPAFFTELVTVLRLIDDPACADQYDRSSWPAMRAAFAERIQAATRDEWEQRFADVDACFAPVLSLGEVAAHPHHAARSAFHVDGRGSVTPEVAPRLSRTPGARPPR